MIFSLDSNWITAAIVICGPGMLAAFHFILKGWERRHPVPMRDFYDI